MRCVGMFQHPQQEKVNKTPERWLRVLLEHQSKNSLRMPKTNVEITPMNVIFSGSRKLRNHLMIVVINF